MKFTCSKQELTRGISTVIRAAYGKVQKSILECIHIHARDELTLDAFDTVMAIKTSVYAQIDEAGETAIPARILSEMINKFPDSDITFESGDEGGVRISAGGTEAVLQAMEADQFPAFPGADGDSFSLKADELARLIDKTSFSAYAGDDKPILTGILIEAGDDAVSAVAIDRSRMAKTCVVHTDVSAARAIVPARCLKEISRLIGASEDEITVTVSRSAIFIELENTRIYTRLIDGEFMNYESIINKNYKTRVRVETAMMIRALELVMVLAKEDSSNLVRISIDQNAMSFSSNSEYGKAANEIPVFTEGEIMKIAFNAKFLLDALKVIDDDSVFLEFSDSLKPCLIRPIDGSEYLYVVVPVSIR